MGRYGPSQSRFEMRGRKRIVIKAKTVLIRIINFNNIFSYLKG
jgi:hypothetical protein